MGFNTIDTTWVNCYTSVQSNYRSEGGQETMSVKMSIINSNNEGIPLPPDLNNDSQDFEIQKRSFEENQQKAVIENVAQHSRRLKSAKGSVPLIDLKRESDNITKRKSKKQGSKCK